eukprot:246680_1
MFTGLLQNIRSTKETFNNLEPKQKYGIAAVAISSVSLITFSYYWHQKKRKSWKKSQEPILSKYWSDSYHEARTKFRNSCSKLSNCKTHSIPVDHMEDLSIDLCYIPRLKNTPKPEHLMIYISGTHGVEGFAGSAIQNKLLENISKNDTNNNYNILFIHALNSFGMNYNRRCNRYNVDLNRNTILNKHKWKRIKQKQPNEGYEILSPLINPGYKPVYPWTDIATWWRMIIGLLKSGSVAKAGNAIVNGQYHKATGIFYGGFQLQNEQKKLFNFIVNECKSVWNVDLLGLMQEQNSKLTIVDIHTGIGPKGVDLLLSVKQKYIEKAKNLKGFPKEYMNSKQRLQSREKGSELYKVYKDSIGSVPIGIVDLFKNVNRFIDDEYDSDKDWDEKLDNRLDVIALTEEFGTVSGFFVIHGLILENAVYNLQLNEIVDSDIGEVLKFRQKKLRDVFYLSDDVQWKYDVLRRGVALFDCLSAR